MDDVCPQCDIGEFVYNGDGVNECNNCGYIDPDDLDSDAGDSIEDAFRMLSDDDTDTPRTLDQAMLLKEC